MSKVDRINYDESLVIRLVANIVAKTPGVNVNEDFSVTINDNHTALNIIFKPLSPIVNVFQIAREIQDNVYFNIKKSFDLYSVVVNVTVHGGT
ncbi:MAG: hypothetical protein LBS76_03380 [Mycoplasmataceae bacterium]|jgi:uncharacterized alkaline shock family protein YloU|nr:hypothetical protein [Mycoplasmataceae bacterium]